MKKFLAISSVLVVIVIAALFFYVINIDWKNYQHKIEQEFYNATGKEIVFAGPATLKLLPSPYLAASNVKIYNHPIAKGDMPLMDVGRLTVDLSLQELINGELYVKHMALENPQINVTINEDGKLNWENSLANQQREKLQDTQIRLNSITLANASLTLDYPSKAYHLKLDNLTGELMSEDVLGPYRIEGNYMKGATPEGFAISIGRLSDNMPTTLDVAITHPLSESYVRYDGNFQLSNKIFNGNVIIESKNLQRFVSDNFKGFSLDKAYDYPLALTFDINTTDQQINLSNMVVKYGDTQGAGTAQIPVESIFDLGNTDERPRVAMAFNFTDLDLSPLSYAVTKFLKDYSGSENAYNPNWPIDLQLDVKSLRTLYNNQAVKDFDVSLDVIGGTLNVNHISAVLPGNTEVRVKGDLAELDMQPFYNADVTFKSDDFAKFLEWIGYAPDMIVPSTYKKANGNIKLSGSPGKIYVSPFSITLDKTSFSGEAGIKLDGPRKDMMISVTGDSVNFDNYVPQIPVEEQEKTWWNRMKYRFEKLSFLNDFDMQLTAKLDLAIFQSVPFENIDVQLSMFDGKADIEKLHIGSVYNSMVDVDGLLQGFGGKPKFENFNYKIASEDFKNLSEKLDLPLSHLDYNQIKTFRAEGALNGTIDKMATQSVFKLGDLDVQYRGQIDNTKPNLFFDGDLEAKHPDFVKMVKSFGFNYDPKVYNLGLFDLKTKFIGDQNLFVAKPFDMHIGFNNFSGSVDYDTQGERPNVFADLVINKFEIEKFFSFNDNDTSPLINVNSSEKADFFAKPYWSKKQFDFAALKNFNATGDLKIAELSFKDKVFANAEMNVALVNDVLTVNNFKSTYKEGELTSKLELNIKDDPLLNGSFVVNHLNVARLGVGGTKYALASGKMDGEGSFSGNFGSADAFMNSLQGQVKFTVKDPEIKGWNLENIYRDISSREKAEGMNEVFISNLRNGLTRFSSIEGNFEIKAPIFTLMATQFVGNNVKLTASGEADLLNWTGNLLFNVKYDQPQYLPGYSFELKGPLNAPELLVNVQSLFDMYKGRQDRIEEQERVIQEAENNRIRLLVVEQRRQAEALLDEAQNKLGKEISDMLGNVEGAEAKKKYQDLQTSLQDEVVLISDLINRSQALQQPTEKDVEDMEKENGEITAFLENIRRSVQDVYLSDLKYQMNNLYEKYVTESNQFKSLAEDLLKDKPSYLERLNAVSSNYDLENDGKIMAWENSINELKESNLNKDKNMEKAFSSLKMTKSQDEVLKLTSQLRDEIQLLQENKAKAEDIIKQYQSYALERVTAEEDKYQKAKREEEVERKLKENTGSILIKKSGRHIIMKRDIDEIEKVEELTSQNKLKVLDFSKPKVQEPEKEQENTEHKNVVKRGR